MIVFAGCSTIKPSMNDTPISLDENILTSTIQRSVDELLAGEWLSEYLTQHNERPLLMTSKITGNSRVLFSYDKAYENIDLSLIESGQVRVVKTNENQRILSPLELVKGKSVDYVISASLNRLSTSTPNTILLVLSLWDGKSNDPLLTIQNRIE
jgi:hypothetical protein